MEYAVIGIVVISVLVIGIVVISFNKKRDELQKNIDELNATLQYEKMQNLLKETEINNLKEYKEKFDQINNEYQKNKEYLKEIETKLNENQNLLNQKQNEIEELKEEIKNISSENSKLLVENQELKTKQEELEKSYNEKIKLLEDSEERLKTSFENLANKILEQTNEKMTKTSKENIENILSPLKNELKEFKSKIEMFNIKEVEKISALENELKNLKELSHKLSSDAENLTKALKGESKTQGNWGEFVLERVLELSGLEEGREYEREVVLKDIENKTYRPDVIVHLPNNRDVIIDAKTSLNAYQEYIKTEDKAFIKTHIQAIKNHIDTLAEKKYEHLKGINTLDFIFMFVPIENALLLALENDSNLFEYAFKKRVVLVSPTTLLVSLRAIESSWRFEKQAKNIEDVVKQADSLYDKVRGFTEDFEKIGKSLDMAKDTFEKAKNKLTTGRGNVIRQIQLLKEKAGIKPKKEISKELIE